MLILALECSTPRAELALCGPEYRPLATAAWTEPRARHETLFDRLPRLLADAACRWEDLDLIAVGRGPGAYSGLRVSLLAAQALAAPSGIPVRAVSSMEAMARRLLAERDLDALLVVGDARRGTFWHGRCTRHRQPADPPVAWRADPPDILAPLLAATPHAATPHPEALAALHVDNPHVNGLTITETPTAADVAALARWYHENHAPPEPLTPLYLHPAV